MQKALEQRPLWISRDSSETHQLKNSDGNPAFFIESSKTSREHSIVDYAKASNKDAPACAVISQGFWNRAGNVRVTRILETNPYSLVACSVVTLRFHTSRVTLTLLIFSKRLEYSHARCPASRCERLESQPYFEDMTRRDFVFLNAIKLSL